MPAQFLIDTNNFKCAAVSCGQTFEYVDGNRTDRVSGSYVEVCVVNRGFEKLRVNLPSTTPLLPDDAEFPEGTFIELDGLKVRPYAKRSGRLAYTASADAARVKGARPDVPSK